MSGETELHAGTGALAIFGRSIGGAGAKVYGNGGSYTIDGDSGNITYYGGDKASTVQAKLGNIKLVGGAGRMTVNGGSRETIVGGSGGLTYNSQGGGANFVQTAAGSNNSLVLSDASVIDSWGKDSIFGGTGNQIMTVHGNAVITGSTGASSLTLMGNDILLGRGYDQVNVTAGANVTISAGTLTAVRETGARVAYSASGSGAGTVLIEGGSATITGGSTTALGVETAGGYSTKVTFLNGKAALTSRGADQIHGGTGSATVLLTAANAELWGGSGTLTVVNKPAAGSVETVHGGSGTIKLIQDDGKTKFIGGTGKAEINLNGGTVDVTGGAGTLLISGGDQGIRFIGGSGDATITRNYGANDITFGSGKTTVFTPDCASASVYHFVAGHGGGVDVINGFRAGLDQLDFVGVSVKSTSVSGGALNLMLSDKTQVKLVGFTSTDHLSS